MSVLTKVSSRPVASGNGSSGFALVTSLLVLVALTSLGIGAFFLTNTNLRIAENARSNAIAYYNAHEGLDLVLLAVAQEYQMRGDSSWPTVEEIRDRLPLGAQFELLELDMDEPDSDGLIPGASVTVQGFGPRQARYETGARFVGQLSEFEAPGPSDPRFGTGWVTESGITVNGNTEFSIGLWAGGDIIGSGGAARVLTIAGFLQAAGDCNIAVEGDSKEFKCESGAAAPEVPLFNFQEALEDLEADRPLCDFTFPGKGKGPFSLGAAHVDKTICIEDGKSVTFTGTARGVYIRGSRTTTVTFEGFTATGTSENFGVKVAAGTIIPGKNSNVTFNGVNTLYSANDFVANSSGFVTRGTQVGSDVYVNTLFATEGSYVIDKAGDPFSGIIWANGSVCKEGGGGTSFVGAILAKGLVAGPCKQKGIYWNGGGGGKFTAIDNNDIPEFDPETGPSYAAAGILVTSKRP